MADVITDIGKFIDMFIKILPGVLFLTVGGVITSALPNKAKIIGLIPIGYGAYLLITAIMPEEVGPGNAEIIEGNVSRGLFNPQELITNVRIRNKLETKGRFRIHAVHRNVNTGYGFIAGDDIITVVDGNVETGTYPLRNTIPADAESGRYKTVITLIDEPTVGESNGILDTLTLEDTFTVGTVVDVTHISVD